MILSRRRLWGLAAAGALAAVLSACTSFNVDPAAQATAQTAYKLFCAGDDAKLEAMFIPEARTPNFHAQLERIRTLVPKGPPPEGKEVNWQAFAGTGGVTNTLVYEYDYPQTVATVTTVLVPGGAKDVWMIRSFNVNVSAPPVDSAPASSTPASSTSAASSAADASTPAKP
jgi:hypothetical protein